MLARPAHPPDPPESASPGILKKFAYLLSARWVRDACQAGFFIYLARVSASTYGEFMLALGLGSILVLVAEFGLNLPLVSLLSQKDGDPGKALERVTFLKSGLLALALLGVVGFMHWQEYAPALQRLMFLISAGVGLEALANTFFVALQVQGRQDLQSKIKALAAGAGFGYGLVALALGAAPLLVAAFKLIEALVNLSGGLMLALARTPFRLRWPSFRKLGGTLRLGLTFGLIEVTAITYNKANLFFLQRYAGAQGVAQYSATGQMVEGVSSLVSSLLLQSVLYPVFVQLWQTDRAQVPRLARNTARWLLAAALVVMFTLFIEADRFILLIYGAQYQDAIWLQKILVLNVGFAFLHNLAAFLIISMRLERLLLAFYLLGLAFNLLWCALVIPLTPLLGGALALVLTKGVVALMTVSYCHRRLGLIPWGAVGQLGVAAVVGGSLYFLGIGWLPRGAAEALALAPVLFLSWRWWRGDDSKPGLAGG
jgi:O-antigen/teichoic acid export membrane protein